MDVFVIRTELEHISVGLAFLTVIARPSPTADATQVNSKLIRLLFANWATFLPDWVTFFPYWATIC